MVREKTAENEDPEIVLIDFNVARRFRDPLSWNNLLMLTMTGAMAYSAPEMRENGSYE